MWPDLKPNPSIPKSPLRWKRWSLSICDAVEVSVQLLLTSGWILHLVFFSVPLLFNKILHFFWRIKLGMGSYVGSFLQCADSVKHNGCSLFGLFFPTSHIEPSLLALSPLAMLKCWYLFARGSECNPFAKVLRFTWHRYLLQSKCHPFFLLWDHWAVPKIASCDFGSHGGNLPGLFTS